VADELTIHVKLAFLLAGASEGVHRSVTFDWRGHEYIKGALDVPTTGRIFTISPIVTPGGWLWLKNTDATNYFKVRPSAGAIVLARVNPGECYLAPVSQRVSIHLEADTATVRIEYMLLAANPDWLELEDSTSEHPHYLLLESSTDEVEGTESANPEDRIEL